MRIAVAMDSFKGSLSSFDAGYAVKMGILQADPAAQITVCPLADGGEGTVQALHSALGGQWLEVSVCGPLGNRVQAGYCILPDGTALLEMASAAGLPLVAPEKRNPLHTTTFGVGELIRSAIEQGCRNFIVGIGGSATNDGGTGMLSALGYEFLDCNGDPIAPGAKGLAHLHRISNRHVLPELSECRFRIACDVKNPLCGETGCSAVYAPQKGATPDMIWDMDQWLNHYAHIAAKLSPKADPNYPGAGAAGGLGFAFLTFTNAVLESGADIILEQTGLEQQIRDADMVITGEGRLDGQTAMGKGPMAVAALAKQYGKPVIALCGCIGEDARRCNSHGIDAYFPILQSVTTLEDALQPESAKQNLTATATQVFRLIATFRRN